MNPIGIQIIEPNNHFALTLKSALEDTGINSVNIVNTAKSALNVLLKTKPSLNIMDAQLLTGLNEIKTNKSIQELNIPTIFLTDDYTKDINRLKAYKPRDIITKPAKLKDIVRKIEITLNRIKLTYNNTTAKSLEKTSYAHENIYVRHNGKKIKLKMADIHYCKAERNYCQIITKSREYLISIPLKALQNKLNSPSLIRIHRSFLVNIKSIDSLNESYIFINDLSIPISKQYKKEIKQRLIQL